MKRLSLVFLIVIGVLGCSGVGLVATNDPYVKISQANRMSDAGRAAQAQRLLKEAIAIFQQRGDELGVADAYRAFGSLAQTGGGREGVVLVRTPVGISKRVEDLDLAKHYFDLAGEIFARHGRLDMLAYVYNNLGGNSSYRGDPVEACAYFDKALEAARQWEAGESGRTIDAPPDIGAFREMVAKNMVRARCSKT